MALTRDPWQNMEQMVLSVPAQTVQAAETLLGFAGSWASVYNMGPGIRSPLGGNLLVNTPSPIQRKINRTGQPGSPEVHFAPFSYFTNHYGSLLGHPVSFEILGPTIRSPLEWQWVATDNSAVPGTGDTLEIDLLGAFGGDLVLANYHVDDLYGTALVDMAVRPLYLVISQSGSKGIVGGPRGLGDGAIRTDSVGVRDRDPLVPLDETSKYEIFKIQSFDVNTIILEPDKRLATYFSFGMVNPTVARAITIMTPYVTRLVAKPDSGEKAHERVHLFVTPARAATGDAYPKLPDWLDGGVGGPPAWDLWGNGDGFIGEDSHYFPGPQMPVGRPIDTEEGRLWRTDPPAAGDGALLATLPEARYGTFVLVVPNTSQFAVAGWAPLIHITDIIPEQGIPLAAPGIGKLQPELSDLLGWFEVVEVVALLASPEYALILRRAPEIEPVSGTIRVGSPTRFTVATGYIHARYTVHREIPSLWMSPTFSPDQVESSRLKNLIDPSWVERTEKQPRLMSGSTPARADKAIWDTATTAPGSLLDLGFRVVLFPATTYTDIGVTWVTPDWTRPITSREVLLDPSKSTEKQYLDVDYSNGILTFSHEPTRYSPIYPTLDSFTADDNPRGECVFYAACVPYSKMPGQAGPAVRVTGEAGLTGTDHADALSPRRTWRLVDDPAVAQVVTSAAIFDLPANFWALYTVALQGDQRTNLPPTGFVELVEGSDVQGPPLFNVVVGNETLRASTFGYYAMAFVAGPPVDMTVLQGVYGGGRPLVDFVPVTVANPVLSVLRRDIQTRAFADGDLGTDYQHDTTYGCGRKAGTIRFLNCEVTPNKDGSVSVPVGSGNEVDIFVGAGVKQPGTIHFDTLWEAVAYVNATMVAPDPIRVVRIRVIGSTTEPPEHLPIRIEVDGLTTLGNGGDNDSLSTAPKAVIRWTGDPAVGKNGQAHLIDLNSRQRLTFRNLTFECQNIDMPLIADGCIYSVFGYNMQGVAPSIVPVRDLTIENCHSKGAQAFLTLWENNGYFLRATIRDNVATDLVSGGVICRNSGTISSDIQIINNWFTTAVGVNPAIHYVDAGIRLFPILNGPPIFDPATAWTNPGVIQGPFYFSGGVWNFAGDLLGRLGMITQSLVQGNHTLGFTNGILLCGRANAVVGNFVESTTGRGGVLFGYDNIIQGNTWFGVHTLAAAALSPKVGLWVAGGSNGERTTTKIENERVTLGGAAPSDPEDITAARYYIDREIWVCGDTPQVQGCQTRVLWQETYDLILAKLRTVIDQCQLDYLFLDENGGTLAGPVISKSHIKRVRFGTLGVGSIGAALFFGNRFDVLGDAGANSLYRLAASTSKFIGNNILGSFNGAVNRTQEIAGDNNQFVDDVLPGIPTVPLLEGTRITGGYNIIRGNRVIGAGAAIGLSIRGGLVGCLVIGNSVENGGYLEILNPNSAYIGNRATNIVPVGAPPGTPPAANMVVMGNMATLVFGAAPALPVTPFPGGAY